MPSTPRLDKVVKMLVVLKKGVKPIAPKPGLKEDEMMVDYGQFELPLEEYLPHQNDPFNIEKMKK